jgi:hypothetical protein
MSGNLDHLTAPAPKAAAPVGTTRQEAKVTPLKTRTAAMLSATALKTLHERVTRKGQAWIVFGMAADKVEPIGLKLRQVAQVRGDGTLIGVGLAIVSPATGGKLRSDGRIVSPGSTLPAPIGVGGKLPANACGEAWIIGDIVDAPKRVGLERIGETLVFQASDTESVTLANGVIQSVALRVRVGKNAGDAWTCSQGRVYSGGKLPDTDPETLAMAAMDTGEAGEAAIIAAASILTGDTPAKVTRAAGNRAKVNRAKRANAAK